MAQLFIADLVLALIEFLCILLVFQISEMHNSAQELQRTAYSKNNTNKKEVSIDYTKDSKSVTVKTKS